MTEALAPSSPPARPQMPALAHKILIPVKVTARPLAASCHPVFPRDRFQSHEGTANDFNRREFIEGAALVAGSVAATGALAFAG